MAGSMFLLHNAFLKTILRRQTANRKRPMLSNTVRAARLGNNCSPEILPRPMFESLNPPPEFFANVLLKGEAPRLTPSSATP